MNTQWDVEVFSMVILLLCIFFDGSLLYILFGASPIL